MAPSLFQRGSVWKNSHFFTCIYYWKSLYSKPLGPFLTLITCVCVCNDPFPLSDIDHDVAKYRVVLLSMRVFPLSDSDVTTAKFWMDTVLYSFLNDANASLLLSGNRPSDSDVANTIAHWKRAITVSFAVCCHTMCEQHQRNHWYPLSRTRDRRCLRKRSVWMGPYKLAVVVLNILKE